MHPSCVTGSRVGIPSCKPPVSPFAGLNNQRKPVLKRHGDGDPVDPSSPAFDQIGDRLRDKVERDVRDLL